MAIETIDAIEKQLEVEVTEARLAEEHATSEFQAKLQEIKESGAQEVRDKRAFRERVEKSLKSLKGEPLNPGPAKKNGRNGTRKSYVSDKAKEKILEAAAELEQPFTSRMMIEATGLSEPTVNKGLQVLVAEDRILRAPDVEVQRKDGRMQTGIRAFRRG